MRFFLTLFIIMLVIVAAPAAAQGQGKAHVQAQERYFEVLYDVPIMPGMEEVPGEAVLFDTAQGRIASTLAGIKAQSAPAITAYYDRTLAAMGWKKSNENQYVREGQGLRLEFSAKPPVTFVRFTLSPAPQG
jgi:hypothetical protein